MIKKIFWYFTLIFGFLITFFSSTIAIVGIILNLTGKENSPLDTLIFTFLILISFVFLGLKIIKIGRLKLASMGNFSENISKVADVDYGNINQAPASRIDGHTGNESTNKGVDTLLVKKLFSSYCSRFNNPLTKKIFSWFMVVTGGLIIFLTVSVFLTYFFILKTYAVKHYLVAFFYSFLPVLFFIILGLYIIKVGKGEMYPHNQKLKVTIKHLVSILFGLLIINMGTFYPLFVLSIGGEDLTLIAIKWLILHDPLLMLFTFGMVYMGVWIIIRSISTWRKAMDVKSPKPEEFGPLIL